MRASRGGSRLRRLAVAALATMACLAALAPAAQGSFGLEGLDVTFSAADGSMISRAGLHPFAMRTSFRFPSEEIGGEPILQEAPKDIRLRQIAGFAGNPTAVKPCTNADFLTLRPISNKVPECSDESAIGTVLVEIAGTGEGVGHFGPSPVYELAPPPGVAAKLGMWVQNVPITVEVGVDEAAPHEVIASLSNISEVIEVLGSELTLWGVPADPRHDEERGACTVASVTECAFEGARKPFLTLPRACRGPLGTSWSADSWVHPGAFFSGEALTHGESGAPEGFGDCGGLDFGPRIAAKPSSRAAQSPSGLDFSLDVEDEGLTNANEGARAASDIEKTVVTLPEGMSVNPSQAEGLEACSEAQLAEETAFTPPGVGCPQASKIGTVEVETPLLEEKLLKGSLFVAEPYHNLAGDSLIALYVAIQDPGLGIGLSIPLRVEADPATGRLTTTAEDLPQLPFSHFRLHFREGGRAPLISPPGCGTFSAKALLYPYSGNPPLLSTSTFQIVSGPDNSPCPSGAAPFDPSFEAGTVNNAAGRYSPFYMRIARGDGEQDLTRLSQVLPPGVAGKLTGIPYCPEAGIAQAMARTGEHGGTAELADPSCPAASQIGRTIAGAGVGSQLTYVPGRLYLAGPYHGDPLSVVSITPALAGPFDAGTVVVRFALALDPVSGEVKLDGSASDPIPHILQGIPLSVRDLRAYVDRPEFTFNATSCEEEQARAQLFGGGTVLAPTPDTPVDASARYQAAGCRALGFKPKLAIALRGGTRRGSHPALRAIVTPRPFRDANFSRAVVTLPHSAFLEQAHIRTVCTRVQFAAGAGNGEQCPAGSVYGHARAFTPLLDEPLAGPVFLRSSSHNLPDLVVALHGVVDIDLDARIDSVHGGIRSTFVAIPDAPVSSFVLDMQGGKKGLIVNSRNLCLKPDANRAKANLLAHDGKAERLKPVVEAPGCAKARHKKHRRHRRR